MKLIHPNGVIGAAPVRVDGVAKVTGEALYGADHVLPGAAHAFLVTAPVAKAKITSIETERALAMPGVLHIMTYENVGREIKPGKTMVSGGYMSHPVAPLRSSRVHFAGQIVAVVVAKTREEAHAAAEAVLITYKVSKPAVSFDQPGIKPAKAEALGETELEAGDVSVGLKQAVATIDAWYDTPAQHHNPLELFQTTCAWSEDGEELTVWESSQNVRGYQYGLAQQLGIQPAKVRVLSPFIGGAFGSRGELGQMTALVALAAKRLKRPVKLMATRDQCFTLRTFRAETRHHLRVGADREGRLTALEHDSWEMCSHEDHFSVAGSDSTARLYACPNVKTKVVAMEGDRQSPGFMRAPPEMPYLFAFESALDELSYALGMDPLELRRRNDTMQEMVTGKPYTSRSLLRCIDKGEELFGWKERNPKPRSMSDGDWLVGWGFSTAFYPTMMGPAQCRVTLTPEGTAKVEVGTHEIGTGIRTVVAQTASDLLGVELAAVELAIGDSRLPAAPLSAGSNSTATVCTVVGIACEQMRERLARAACAARGGALEGVAPESMALRGGQLVAGQRSEPLSVAVRRVGHGRPVVEEGVNNPHGAPPLIGPKLVERGKPLIVGGANLKDRMQFAFGAQFVEVRVDRWTGEIRVPRALGVFAAGRIMNPRTAHSQLTGGQIWGISAALFEATEMDRHAGRYVNRDLSEYHMPVAADIGKVEAIMLEETDHLINPLGIKGVGELGLTGMNAAVANAVFHATGVRVRKLPIRVGFHSLTAPGNDLRAGPAV